MVIPTGFVRHGELVYMHGRYFFILVLNNSQAGYFSAASRMIKNLSQGFDVCVTVTLMDGLVKTAEVVTGLV
jgi:nitroimidazol reductase NimA-like FMN-containing flavoprotein (pyridoxamine 5'-phosphate oxidase superfamily)